MNDQDDLFEKEASKYLDIFGSEGSPENQATPEVAETPHEEDWETASDEEQEAQMQKIAEDAKRNQEALNHQPFHLSGEAEKLRHQREEFFKGIDIEAEKKKAQSAVTPESDKFFFAWLRMRFPGLVEEVERECLEERKRQLEQQKKDQAEIDALFHDDTDGETEEEEEQQQ